MDRALIAGSSAFIVAYLSLGCLATAGLASIGWDNGSVNNAVLYGLVAALAIVAGLRLGRLNAIGVAVASLLLALGMQWLIVHVLDALARPAGGSVSFVQFYREPFLANSLFTLCATVGAPVLWLMMLRYVGGAREQGGLPG